MRLVALLILSFCTMACIYGQVDGFPVELGVGESLPLWGAPAAVKLDSTVFIAMGSTDEFLYAFYLDGSAVEGFPVDVGGPVRGKIAWEPYGFGASFFILTIDGILSRVDWDGAGTVILFQDDRGDSSGFVAPVLADIDDNGEIEIIAAIDTTLFCLTDDGGVFWSAGFMSSTGSAVAAPACGDVDGDGSLEIVVLGYESITVFNSDGDIIEGFPAELEDDKYFSYSSPILFDYDNDGAYEIFCGGHSTSGYEFGIVVAFESDGSQIDDPFYTISSYGGWIYSPPAWGDINGDYQPDLAFGTVTGAVFGVNTSGSLSSFGGVGLDHPGHIYGSVMLCDLDNEPGPEYIFELIEESASITTLVIIEPGAEDIENFPDTIESETGGILSPTVFIYGESTYVSMATGDGELYLWGFPIMPLPGYANWMELYGDRRNRGLAPPHKPAASVEELADGEYEIYWTQIQNPDFLCYNLYLSTDSAGTDYEIIATIENIADTEYIYETSAPEESLWFFVVIEDSLGRTSLKTIPVCPYDTTAIAEQAAFGNENRAINISPNPFNSSCFVRYNGGESIRIYDISGRLLKSEKMEHSSIQIDAESLPSGILVFVINDSNGKCIGKGNAVLIR